MRRSNRTRLRVCLFAVGILAAAWLSMTWLDMANLLFDSSGALSPRSAHLHLDTAAWFRTWTPHQNQAADSSAHFFARNRQWPSMEEEPASQLYFRCLYAIENCIDYHARNARSPATLEAERKALESLLVDTWHLKGLEWAERRYQGESNRSMSGYTVRVRRS
jgi:hypothetical protein